MKLRRRTLLQLATPGLGLGLDWAQAQPEAVLRIEGQSLPRRLRVGESELQLNGAGVRAVAWFKAFVAGLYLSLPARSAADVVQTPGPKRLRLVLLHEVPAAELGRALQRGVARNAPAEQLPALQPPLAELAGGIDKLGRLRVGDALDLDWDPTRGLFLRLNGTLRGPVLAEPALYEAVLLSFVGQRPYDRRLQAALLGLADSTKNTTSGD